LAAMQSPPQCRHGLQVAQRLALKTGDRASLDLAVRSLRRFDAGAEIDHTIAAAARQDLIRGQILRVLPRSQADLQFIFADHAFSDQAVGVYVNAPSSSKICWMPKPPML